MPKATIVRTSLVGRFGLVAFILWAAPSCLQSQGASLSQQPHSSTGQPFAQFDDSLTRVADSLLITTVQRVQSTPPATSKTDVAKPSGVPPDREHGQRSWPLGAGALSAAELRLSLLRPAVDPILRSHSIPTDLAAVILVESGGRSTALSPKGARGLWQLMPNTARRYGLRVDEMQDDRLDLFRATDAAARYLHDLYAQFGDWKLVLAAYNTGEVHVGAAILKAHTQDFDQLANLRMLPLETRNYVPRVLAAAHSTGQLLTFADSRTLSTTTTVFAVSNPTLPQ